MPLNLCERWQLQKHRKGFMGPVDEMYPSESWREWAQWFPCWEDKDMRSLRKEVRRKLREVARLLVEKEREEHAELQQSSPERNTVSFLQGFLTGLSVARGVATLIKAAIDIPLTVGALRFNLNKLLQIQQLVEQEIHRREQGANQQPAAVHRCGAEMRKPSVISK